MKIAFVVNDVMTEKAAFTTTIFEALPSRVRCIKSTPNFPCAGRSNANNRSSKSGL